MRTRPVFSNCQFGAFYLLIRGKADKIVFVRGGNKFIPWHAGILTKGGHYINFYRLLPHKENIFGAWWFWGSFRGLRRSKWKSIIAKRGESKYISPWLAMMIYTLCYLGLFIPWTIAWALYTPIWNFKWAFRGLRKRFSHR